MSSPPPEGRHNFGSGGVDGARTTSLAAPITDASCGSYGRSAGGREIRAATNLIVPEVPHV